MAFQCRRTAHNMHPRRVVPDPEKRSRPEGFTSDLQCRWWAIVDGPVTAYTCSGGPTQGAKRLLDDFESLQF